MDVVLQFVAFVSYFCRAQLLQQSRRAAGGDAEEEAERQQREQIAREREKDIERAVRLEVRMHLCCPLSVVLRTHLTPALFFRMFFWH